jgi:hypothetical protein
MSEDTVDDMAFRDKGDDRLPLGLVGPVAHPLRRRAVLHAFHNHGVPGTIPREATSRPGLMRTVHPRRVPRNVLTVCVGKSTYAHCGIITNVTPFEPEWEGFVTLEISNTTPLPARIYANEGVAQVLFFKGEEEPEVSYKDKKGKYQHQHAVTLPKL